MTTARQSEGLLERRTVRSAEPSAGGTETCDRGVEVPDGACHMVDPNVLAPQTLPRDFRIGELDHLYGDLRARQEHCAQGELRKFELRYERKGVRRGEHRGPQVEISSNVTDVMYAPQHSRINSPSA